MQSLVPGVFLLPCIWKKLPVAGYVDTKVCKKSCHLQELPLAVPYERMAVQTKTLQEYIL